MSDIEQKPKESKTPIQKYFDDGFIIFTTITLGVLALSIFNILTLREQIFISAITAFYRTREIFKK